MDRFSLLLLEPGEIYFTDVAVTYYRDTTKSPTADGNHCRGRLKICSKSIVFVPQANPNQVDMEPLLKFLLCDCTKIVGKISITKYPLFSDESFSINLFLEWLPRSFRSPLAKETNVISLTSKGRVEMLDKNILAPFKFIREVKTFIFALKYAKVDDHLPLMCQLQRASTLPPVEQNGMVGAIVYSMQSRTEFDSCWLESVQETILHKVLLLLKLLRLKSRFSRKPRDPYPLECRDSGTPHY
jgi:factor associated with neutral sphingomyelinase activation